MALPASGALSFNAIQIELGRTTGQANFSINAAEAGTYAAINTGNPVNDRPNGATPNAASEWYSYNHTFAASDITGANVTGSFQPGDGGGSMDVEWTLNGPIGTGYITIEPFVTAGDSIVNIGSQGVQGNYTTSPQTTNIVTGPNAEGYAVVRLYNAGNTLLDTYTTIDTILPL